MNTYFKSTLLEATSADSFFEKEAIQALWSGYGRILRIGLKGAPMKSVVAKHVQLPEQRDHPRGGGIPTWGIKEN